MAKRVTLNQIGVMIEAVDDKVKALGEGLKVLQDKVSTLDVGLKALEDKVTALAEGQMALKEGLGRLDRKVDQVHTSLKNEIQSTFYALNDKLEEHIKQPSHV